MASDIKSVIKTSKNICQRGNKTDLDSKLYKIIFLNTLTDIFACLKQRLIVSILKYMLLDSIYNTFLH